MMRVFSISVILSTGKTKVDFSTCCSTELLYSVNYPKIKKRTIIAFSNKCPSYSKTINYKLQIIRECQ